MGRHARSNHSRFQDDRSALSVSAPALPPSGFTLMELMVVISVIAILIGLLLPALSHVKSSAKGVQCGSNVRQMHLSWQTFASDHKDRLVNNGGWARGNFTNPPSAVNTDRQLLRDSLLGPYIKDVDVYKCPGDDSINVRSYAMNNHMGGLRFDNHGVVFKAMYQIRLPTQYFVFIDEDLKTINDSLFRVDVGPTSMAMDKPASFHGGTCRLVFADGHTETYRWVDPTPDDRIWLKAHTSSLQ